MGVRRHHRSWTVFELGFLAALLALIGQLALGAVVAAGPGTDEVAALDAAMILCTGDVPAPDGAPRHHVPDVTLCPLTVTLALPAIVLTPAPVVYVPAPMGVVRDRERPPGRGPPAATARVGTPRAPPFIA